MSPLRFALIAILLFLVYRAVVRGMGGGKRKELKSPPAPKPKPLAPPPPPSETVDGRDPHEILGVEKGASLEVIRAAYQKLVKEYHPDRAATLASEIRDLAEKRTRELNRAYEILTKR
ncbi:MAG: J domain-containing protein [Myxococcales bacterium]|nr:J domain-containing protein [Myxococcales bacterium]